MRTIQEVEAWREGAALECGDPSLPVCQLFVRYVEADHRPRRPEEFFELFCYRDRDERYVLWLGPDLVVPVPIAREKVTSYDGEVEAYGVEPIAPGVWTLTPSLNLPGEIHGFVILYDVPSIPPWERLVLLPHEVSA